ncbi:MAG: hypothetical protein ACK4ND_07545 [Cytophagaceae bacterium]
MGFYRNGDNPLNLSGAVEDINSGSIHSFIPDTLTPGMNYKIRVSGSSPTTQGEAYTIPANQIPVIYAGADKEIC